MSDRMSERTVASLRRHGRHRVSDNLYLQVGKDGRRSWVFRYQLGGKAHMMGLGAADLRTLAEARELAHQLRRQLHLEGVDPLQHRRVELAQAKIDDARSSAFQECAARFIKAHETNWSARHRQAWRNTLTQHVYPTIGAVPVGQIGKDEVLRCLEPIWHDLPVTAARVRNRIAQVLDWAAARDLRSHDNPAKRPKLLPTIKRQVRHLTAMSYAEVPAFLLELRKQQGVAARALEFAILTATRRGEVLGARWEEIDLDHAVWTIPPERMKGGKTLRIPLSRQAVDLLQGLPRDGDLVFHRPQHPARMLRHSEPLRVIRRMGRGETVHGFRSSFSDWAHETTGYPNHIIEMSLAHTVGTAVERAYQRSDLFSRRRQLMDAWSAFLAAPPAAGGEVVALRGRA
jgi:integrase